MRRPAVLIAAALLATAAADAPPFQFMPVPRWQVGPHEEPETEQVCAAIKAECTGIKDVTDIHADFGYEALYDPDGMLAGLRMTRSTGCKPLDEYLLLSQRKFAMAFHEDGKPDLEKIHVELAPGTPRDAVRLVKADGTSLSMGCNP